MILSDGTIKDSVLTGDIDVDPLPDRNQYQPASLDLRLADSYIDHETGEEYEGVDEIALEPDDFFLCSTQERLSVPDDLLVEVTGRSSYGREGILIHCTAGLVDPGWDGDITLEMKNLSKKSFTMCPGDRVCQATFTVLNKPCEVSYGDEERDSKYQGQSGPTKSRR